MERWTGAARHRRHPERRGRRRTACAASPSASPRSPSPPSPHVGCRLPVPSGLDEGPRSTGAWSVDITVLALGSLGVLLAVTVERGGPAGAGPGAAARSPVAPRTRWRRFAGLPPVLTAGLHLARRGDRGRASRSGRPSSASARPWWSASRPSGWRRASMTSPARRRGSAHRGTSRSAAAPSATSRSRRVLADERRLSSVSEAAGIVGADMVIGDETAWVARLHPLDAVPDPAWRRPLRRSTRCRAYALADTDGRPPRPLREIAVGAVTLRALGLSIGDSVTVTSATGGGDSFEMDIVGVAVINDTFEASPGRGAIAPPRSSPRRRPRSPGTWIRGPAPRRGHGPGGVRRRRSGGLRRSRPAPIQQAGVRNVGRIRGLPFLMAAVVAVLAVASLLHALVLSVSRNRRALGVLKGIGFTRHRSARPSPATPPPWPSSRSVAAVPLGIVAGRWGWQLVADQIGVPSVAIVPALPAVAIAIVASVLANVVAAYPAWRAAAPAHRRGPAVRIGQPEVAGSWSAPTAATSRAGRR